MYTSPCLNNLVIEYTPPDLQDGHTHTAGHEIADIHHSQQSTQHQATKPAIPKVIIGQNKSPLISPPKPPNARTAAARTNSTNLPAIHSSFPLPFQKQTGR